MADFPKIGVFRNDQPIILRPAPNGGWIVSQGAERMGEMASEIGAYTTAKEMLDALAFAMMVEESR